MIENMAGEGVSAPTLVADFSARTATHELYRTIDEHGVDRQTHLATLSMRAEHLGIAPQRIGPSDAVLMLRSVTIRLHDNNIAVIDSSVSITGSSSELAALSAEELSSASVEFGSSIVAECSRRYLEPLCALARSIDGHHRVIDRPFAPDDQRRDDIGHAVWVARALLIERHDDDVVELATSWLDDTGVDARATVAQLRRPEGADHCIRWLQYLLVFDDLDESTTTDQHGLRGLDDAWEALLIGQYFYSALDRIDLQLSRVLAEASGGLSGWHAAALHRDLETLSHRAELLLLTRRDVAKYLTRPVRFELDALLESWDYSTVLHEPVMQKIASCERRLAALAARRAARSTLITDVILLGIAITGILGTALALSAFGRESLNDPNAGGFDLGRSQLVDWFAAQSADVVVGAAVSVSALIALVYLYFRRAHR